MHFTRKDQRLPDALRTVRIERQVSKHADGSCLIEFGDTRVLCTAMFAERVPPFLRDKGEGWVTAEYAMLPASSSERIPRDHIEKGRAKEISRLIGRVLRAVVDRRAMGECMVTVDCDVLQADGGTRTASITGGYIALYDAFRSSMAKRRLAQLPLRAACAAVSVGVVDGVPCLDLNYEEDSRAEVDMNVVMDSEGRYLEVQGSAEGAPFNRVELDTMLDLATAGNLALMRHQREALGLA